MVELEAITFVNDQVKGRHSRLTDVQFGDWVAVVMRTDYATARQIIEDIATDPEEPFLTVKAFAKRLRQHTAKLHAARQQAEAPAPCLDVCTAEEAYKKIFAGPDCGAKRWLTYYLAHQKDREGQAAAPAPAAPPAEALTYECSQGHAFTVPDRTRCPVGCCPQCREANRNYKIVTPTMALES